MMSKDKNPKKRARINDPVELALKNTLNSIKDKYHDKYMIFVGLSGGVDSMALASALDNLLTDEDRKKHEPTALHLDHMLRGKDSDMDRESVKKWAEDHSWNFIEKRVKVSELAFESGISIETAAREIRYDFYQSSMSRMTGAGIRPVLFLGHHLEDQAESILLHLFRGSGSKGVCGMKAFEERDNYSLARPLLGLYKKDLISFNKRIGLDWREDITNFEADVSRNYLRLEIMPLIRDRLNPNLDRGLADFSNIIRGESQYLDEKAKELYKEASEAVNDSDLRNKILLESSCLDKKIVKNAHLALQRRLIYNWTAEIFSYRDDNISMNNIENIRRLFYSSSGKIFSIYGMIFLSDYRAVHLFKPCNFTENNLKNDFSYEINLDSFEEGKKDGNGVLYDPLSKTTKVNLTLPLKSRIIFQRIKEAPKPEKMKADSLNNIIYIDGRELEKLYIRRISGSERFVKRNSDSQQINKMFNQWHLPSILRERQIALSDDENILWIPPLGRSGIRPAEPGQEAIKAEWRLVDSEK